MAIAIQAKQPTTQSTPQPTVGELAKQFFARSAGVWQSQRRYYTLKTNEPQECVSHVMIEFLPQGHALLVQLAQLHHLPTPVQLLAGGYITWENHYLKATRQPATGETVIGVLGSTLYRDRGFSTHQPVTADLSFINPDTMRLVTHYGKSSFEEEIKFVGEKYRTRQTIATREGEEVLIGQYLETRLLS